jgi:hypothetical protein
MRLERLLQALGEGEAQREACAFCGAVRHQGARYLEGVANDGVNDVPLRQRLARTGGYCARHCRWLASHASMLSVAILFEDFLRARLERARAGQRPLTVRCEACRVEREAEGRLLQGVKQHRHDERLGARLAALPLCLGHLEAVARRVPSARAVLTSRHEPLLQQLAEAIRKHDYRFADESLSDDERQSLRHFLAFLGD